MSAIKPKRIRIRKTPLKPTYASLKVKSMQDNPICWISCPGNDPNFDNVYVLRKLLITEQDYLQDEVLVNLNDINYIQSIITMNQLRFDERIIKATVSKLEFENWCENFAIGPDTETSIFQVLTEEARTAITLYNLFLQPFRNFLPCRIARVVHGSTTFEHPTRGMQPIHCRVQFQGQVGEAVTSPSLTEKEPELTAEYSANLLRCHEMYMYNNRWGGFTFGCTS